MIATTIQVKSRKKEILHNPNQEQQKIIQDYINDKNRRFAYMIFAPPGSGKTFMAKLTIHKLIHEKNVDPTNILFLTFNKVLSEDINTSLKLTGSCNTKMAFTISSLALKIINKLDEKYIKQRKFKPLQETKIKQMLKKIVVCKKGQIIQMLNINILKINQQNQQDNEERQFNRLITRLFAMITEIHANNKTLDMYIEEKKSRKPLTDKQKFDFKIIELYFQQARNKKNDEQILAFDHMICEAISKIKNTKQRFQVNLPKQCLCQYIIIDEFQDLNKAQLDLLISLVQKRQNRKFLFMGDPDQNIYQWRYAKYKNFENFEQQLQNVFDFYIKKYGLRINHRLHQKIADLSQKFINFEHQLINYKLLRQNILRNVLNYQSIIPAQTKDDEDILIEQFMNQFDEIRAIIQRIYRLNQKGIQFKKITILLRSLIFSNQFVHKFRFEAKKYQKQMQNQGRKVNIPFLVIGNKNMFNDQQTNFLIRCFEYYFYIKKNPQLSDIKQKKKILNKILLSIKSILRTDNYFKKITQEIDLNLILNNEKFQQCKQFYQKKGQQKQKLKAKMYNNFKQKFNEFLQKCQSQQDNFFQLANFLKDSFYGKDFMTLQINENVESFIEYLQNFYEQNSHQKCWRTFFQNIKASSQQIQQQDLPNKVLIQTLHKSKGCTYQAVFLPFMNGNFEWLGEADEDLAYINTDIASDVARRNQQLRLYYTGITRTKGSLYVSRTCKMNGDEPKRQFIFLTKLTQSYQKIPGTTRGDQHKKDYYNKRQEQKSKKKSKSNSKRTRGQLQSQQLQPNTNNQRKIKVNNNRQITFLQTAQENQKHQQKQQGMVEQQNSQNKNITKGSKQNIRKNGKKKQ